MIAVIGSRESGHSEWPGRTTSIGSGDVFADGKGVHRLGDGWPVHCNPPGECHSGTTSNASGTVFANGIAIARVGDSISCGGSISTGINNVFVGD